ncbi:hypothetical protein LY76DRAFT_83362 [Colletotrichum caudatum]|nr:hypothetical protein LY76DRAFT_83362 [Colletotrichum caudatum]
MIGTHRWTTLSVLTCLPAFFCILDVFSRDTHHQSAWDHQHPSSSWLALAHRCTHLASGPLIQTLDEWGSRGDVGANFYCTVPAYLLPAGTALDKVRQVRSGYVPVRYIRKQAAQEGHD